MPAMPPDPGTLPKPGGKEPNGKGESFPLLNHTVTEGWEQRGQEEGNTSLMPALTAMPEDHRVNKQANGIKGNEELGPGWVNGVLALQA